MAQTNWLRELGRFVTVLLVQGLLLNHVRLFGYINPYFYLYFVLLYPLTGNRTILIALSFFLGLGIDMFSDTGGVHAAAAVFAAWIRPLLLKFSFGVSYQYNTIKVPSAPLQQQFIYVVSMVILHHFLLFSLEAFSGRHWALILTNTLASGIFTTGLIIGAFHLFSTSNK
ncbi:MAG: rod shape-determining protein MreD [Flavobacteriaceae bacterium]|nr:rod shape-determining protein MreD [Flavobacteriaceae bacterium]MDG1062889.1 rod shape-determining protein MreD [Flavobacteriaceae bacterium]MDG1961683.1 rod shape-determining protein MreD [Flavobacteriaceae bacterium]